MLIRQYQNLQVIDQIHAIGQRRSIVTCSDEHGAERRRAQAGCQVQRCVSAERAHVDFRLQLCDQRAGHLEQVLPHSQVEGGVPTLLLRGIDFGSALHQQAEAALTVPPHGEVERMKT